MFYTMEPLSRIVEKQDQELLKWAINLRKVHQASVGGSCF